MKKRNLSKKLRNKVEGVFGGSFCILGIRILSVFAKSYQISLRCKIKSNGITQTSERTYLVLFTPFTFCI